MSETTVKIIAQANFVSLIASSVAAILLTIFGIWLFRFLKKRYSNAILLFGFQFFGFFAIFVMTIFTSLYAFDQIYEPYVLRLMELSTDSNAFISSKYGFVPFFDAGPRAEIKLINLGIIIFICTLSFLRTWRVKRVQKDANT